MQFLEIVCMRYVKYNQLFRECQELDNAFFAFPQTGHGEVKLEQLHHVLRLIAV